MRNRIIVLFLLFVSVSAMAAVRQTREEYVEKYKAIAIAHMERYGIPASITMAQGILESDSGNSRLSLSSNNHFGIKCKKSWTGDRVYHDDDAQGECFRAYPTVEASYEDHAKFLDDSPRYDSLFAYPSDDYRSWARGLKAAGYATAADYAERLVKVIEDMKLYLLDQEGKEPAATLEPTSAAAVVETPAVETPAAPVVQEVVPQTTPEPEKPAEEKKAETPQVVEQPKVVEPQPTDAKATENKAENKPEDKNQMVLAPTTSNVAMSDEQVNPNAFRVTVNSYKGYGVYRSNHVSYVVSKEGDTYESLGKIFETSPSLLRRFNDVPKGDKLAKGTIVYIEPKKAKWLGDEMQHKVTEGETIYSISQLYGINLKSLMSLNKINHGEDVKCGDIIRLQ